MQAPQRPVWNYQLVSKSTLMILKLHLSGWNILHIWHEGCEVTAAMRIMSHLVAARMVGTAGGVMRAGAVREFLLADA